MVIVKCQNGQAQPMDLNNVTKKHEVRRHVEFVEKVRNRRSERLSNGSKEA
jgi:hypothetical protein